MRKVDLRSDIRARWVLGVPLLLLAARLIWSGLGPLDVRTVDWGVGVAIVGLVVLGERRYLAVDTRSGLLLSKRGIFYPFTTASFVAADVKYIALVSYARRPTSSGGTTIHRYKLVVNGRPDDALTDLGDRWQARRAGERLCAALNVPFDNRMDGPHSVRPPDELDMPLAERWRHAGKVHERPSLPPQSPLVVEEIGPDAIVSFPAETNNIKWVALLATCFAAMGVFMYSTGPTGAARWFLHLFFGGAAAFFTLTALAFSGRSRLTFSGQRVSFRQGRSLLSRSLEVSSIEELIARPDGIDLVGDSGSVWIDYPGTKADSAFLKAFVAYELSRRT